MTIRFILKMGCRAVVAIFRIPTLLLVATISSKIIYFECILVGMYVLEKKTLFQNKFTRKLTQDDRLNSTSPGDRYLNDSSGDENRRLKSEGKLLAFVTSNYSTNLLL